MQISKFSIRDRASVAVWRKPVRELRQGSPVETQLALRSSKPAWDGKAGYWTTSNEQLGNRSRDILSTVQ